MELATTECKSCTKIYYLLYCYIPGSFKRKHVVVHVGARSPAGYTVLTTDMMSALHLLLFKTIHPCVWILSYSILLVAVVQR
jgi:hypothetical protein